jgi:acyl CoA:acetate/3-ketoacid CoA transferase beta subunit
MMGASQIDRHGNQNISCIGPFERPRAMLLGARGAPGNSVNHPTSYWIPGHSRRTFVPRVDVVCGVGTDRAAALGRGGRFHALRRVITNLGVFDFETPDRTMRVRSIHPGRTIDDILAATGFSLAIPPNVPTTRAPTPDELALLRDVIDPQGLARREVGA